MRIGNLNLSGRVFAAPLAGISNRPFRVLAARAGAAITYTEMVSAEGIVRNQAKTLEMLKFQRDEQPLGAQLFGADPNAIGEAVRKVISGFHPDLIDLNFGCPVRKVVNKNGGAAVLKDLKLTEQIVRQAVTAAGEIPVTIKIRSGWDDATPVFVEVGRIAEDSGAAAVTLHARSRSGGFSGRADWTSVKQLKDAVGIPVIGNGDIATPQDARRMLDETGCDAVMVGRAALGNPRIFKEINHYLETGRALGGPSRAERIQMAREHVRLMVEEYGEARGVLKMRKCFCWYCKGFPGASELRQRLVHVSTVDEFEQILTEAGFPNTETTTQTAAPSGPDARA